MEMSNYCKAYEADMFRRFSKWEERVSPYLIPGSGEQSTAGSSSAESAEARDTAIFYLHDDFTVTAEIFRDQSVVFDVVTDEWKEFCRSVLQFDPLGPVGTVSNTTS